jgi:hypothetical protein
MYNTETGGTTNHDDFGQKGYDIYSDMLASDMVLGALNYGWYSDVARYQSTKDYTLDAAYQPWRYYYRIIFAANGAYTEIHHGPGKGYARIFVFLPCEFLWRWL